MKPSLFTTTAFIALSLAIATPNLALANPEGGQVVGGSAIISEAGKKLDVHQYTERAVIDWRSFDIAIDERTQFHQPSAGSIALNRVNSTNPSRIAGQLSANGNIILVNPNGVFFEGTSRVDVNGLVAATANINPQDFMDGSNHLNITGNPNAFIVNEGQIKAKEAGLVGLVAPNVINNGVINAKMGRAQLSSGDTVTVDFYGDDLLKVAVHDDNVKSQLVANSGVLSANGGRVGMTAAAAGKTINALIMADGLIEAKSIGKDSSGKIIIGAAGSNKTDKTGNSYVTISGNVDASGRDIGEQGGKIDVFGDHIAIIDGAFIDASGYEALIPDRKPNTGTATLKADKTYDNGVRTEEEFWAQDSRAGGSIKIGGDYLGKGESQTAKTVAVSDNAYIANDAIKLGDAGRTIIWSDDTTSFSGNVFARGGKEGGNGGFVETSGKINLKANGYVDLSNRTEGYYKGTYLLDPDTITIYGNVDPTFVSTDTSIDLNSDLALWLDADDASTVELTYSDDLLAGATGSGTIGTNTITTSADVSANLQVGARIRLGAQGTITTADTLGTDTYTITNIAGNNITVQETLTNTYIGEDLRRGLISKWGDKANSNDATQTAQNNMPLWLASSTDFNNKGTIYFQGDSSSDYLRIPHTDTLNINNAKGIFSIYRIPNGIFGWDPILAKDHSNANQGWRIVQKSFNNLQFETLAGPDLNLENNIGNDASIYSAYATSSTIAAYINGGNGGIINSSFNDSIADLLIGARNDNNASGSINAALMGNIPEVIIYDGTATEQDNSRNLVNQYLSAKWDLALDPLAGGGTEVAEATAHDAGDPTNAATNGYNVFTTRYLERLAGTSDLVLQASSGITLDLQGDTLNLTDSSSTAGKSITLQTDNGDITDISAGTIRTTRTGSGTGLNGNISLVAGGAGNIDLGTTNLEALNGGQVSFSATGGDINLMQTSALSLGSVSAQTVSMQTTGSTSDITLNGNVTATDSGNALIMAAGRNFINNAGAGALNATDASGRWLIYSSDPAANTLGGAASDFKRYNRTYAGYAPGSVVESGNGLLYSIAPTLSLTADDATRQFGNANPEFTYSLAGFIDGDTAATTDAVSGTPAFISASATDGPGDYAITPSLGTLMSDLGYQFTTFNDGTLEITPAPQTITNLPNTVQQNFAGRVNNNTSQDIGSFGIPQNTYLPDNKIYVEIESGEPAGNSPTPTQTQNRLIKLRIDKDLADTFGLNFEDGIL